MPHIRIRGMQEAQVQQLSVNLTEDLSEILNTGKDNFTIEYIASRFFIDGKPDGSYPFVEVSWFERPMDLKKRCAQLITDKVKETLKCDDVVVVFHILKKDDYFENGAHFA